MIIVSLLGLFLVILFGYLFVNILLNKAPLLEKIALGYIIGFGFFTYILFLINLYGLKFGLIESGLVLIILIFLTVFLNFIFNKDIKFKIKIADIVSSLSVFEIISLLFLLLLVSTLFIFNFYWPMRGTDAFILYDFRAISFVETGFMNDAIARGYFVPYPLLTSLSHTWLYLVGFTNPMILYSLFFLSFMILFYYSLNKILDSKASIVLTLVLFLFPDLYGQAQIAYTNLPYTIYIVMGSIYLYLGIKLKNNGYLLISLLLTAISGWTRNTEPFWVVNIILFLIYGLFDRKNMILSIFYAFIVNTSRQPWNNLYNSITSGHLEVKSLIQSNTAVLINGVSNFDSVNDLLYYLLYYAVRPYFVLYIILGLIILYKIITKSKDWWFIVLIFGYLGLLIISTYTFSLTFTEWKSIFSSLQRVLIFIPPLIIFGVGCYLSEFKAIIKK